MFPRNTDIITFKKQLEKYDNIDWSDSIIERLSISGDISGNPFYHFRWKKKYLADIIVWPKSEEEISKIVRLADEYNIPITVRGGGTEYFGSSLPTMGGIIFDLKSFNHYNINLVEKTITVQAGSCIGTIFKAIEKKGLEMPSYPSSALSATIGGWISSHGSIGIGTYEHGNFSHYITELDYITSTGEQKHLDKPDLIKKVLGTYGVLAIFTKVKFKLLEKKPKFGFLYGLENMDKLSAILERLNQFKDIHYIGISDKNHFEKLNRKIPYPYILLIISSDSTKVGIDKLGNIEKHIPYRLDSMKYLGSDISEKIISDLLKNEISLKERVPTLMLQSFLISVSNIGRIIKYFRRLIKERNLNEGILATISSNHQIRLNLYTFTDNDLIIHFLSSKGVLHRVVKYIYKNQLGRLYEYGLYNGIYFEKFEKEKLIKMRKQKIKNDPKFILNPLKLIENRTSFTRINILFELNLLWRKIATHLGIAKNLYLI